jgi:hypothetical protein
MSDEEHEGVEQVMLQRFVETTLPVVMEIKANADAGKKLTEGELEIMERLIERAKAFGPITYEFPELQSLIAKIIDLYDQIAEEALDNEQREDN